VPAIAQQKAEFPREGNYDSTTCWAGTVTSIDFSKTHGGGTYDISATNRSNPPGGFLDMTSFRCLGSFNIIDGKSSGMNICKGVDKDGDKILIKNITDGLNETTEAIAGTGKYEGTVRTGTGERLGGFPVVTPGTIQGCTHSAGTYKMKLEATGTTAPPATTPSK
jgi:hypothetical protein